MYTPPASFTENELPISSPASRLERTTPLSHAMVATTPFADTSHSRPSKSGRTDTIWSPGGTVVVRS